MQIDAKTKKLMVSIHASGGEATNVSASLY